MDDKDIQEFKKKVTDLETTENKRKKVNDVANGINDIPAVTLSDVTGTPNITFDPTGADAIISNLQIQNNLMNGQVELLVSTINKILQNVRGQ